MGIAILERFGELTLIPVSCIIIWDLEESHEGHSEGVYRDL